MPDKDEFLGERPNAPDPRLDDIMAGDRRISRPDSSLPDWEVPDTSYRPIPIVWFCAALLAQLISMAVSFKILLALHPYFTIGLCALMTGLIGRWTWERGMSGAGRGWKAATIIMLALQFGFAALLAFAIAQMR